MDTKAALRVEMRDLIGSLSDEQKKIQSQQVSEQLILLIENNEYRTIALYYALEDELDLTMLLQRCLNSWKVVLLPKIWDDEMKFYQLHDGEELTPWVYDIPEPPEENPRTDIIDLVVVPGRAFDTEGRRLGRWGGFYDKYLNLHKPIDVPPDKEVGSSERSEEETGGLLVWVCFSEQIVEEVPVDDWDISMDEVITSREH